MAISSEDIGIDEELPRERTFREKYPEVYEVTCVGCQQRMSLRDGKFGPFYSCRACNICLSCHSYSSKPMGTQADQETRLLRKEVYTLTCELTDKLRVPSYMEAGEMSFLDEVDDLTAYEFDRTAPRNKNFHEVLEDVAHEMGLQYQLPSIMDNRINYFDADQCRAALNVLRSKLGTLTRFNFEPLVLTRKGPGEGPLLSVAVRGRLGWGRRRVLTQDLIHQAIPRDLVGQTPSHQPANFQHGIVVD